MKMIECQMVLFLLNFDRIEKKKGKMKTEESILRNSVIPERVRKPCSTRGTAVTCRLWWKSKSTDVIYLTEWRSLSLRPHLWMYFVICENTRGRCNLEENEIKMISLQQRKQIRKTHFSQIFKCSLSLSMGWRLNCVLKWNI